MSDPVVPSDEFGKVEARGIDFIPPDERHGKPRQLFAVWAAANINYLYIVLGGLLTVFGLNVWQAMVAVVVGNLFWAAIGVMGTSGPAAGAPSSVIMRAMYGARGNRFNLAIFQWPVFIAYEAINLCLGALAGYAVVEAWGGSLPTAARVAVVFVTAGATLTISVYGHATIMRMSGVFTVMLAAAMAVLAIFVVAHADWGYQPAAELSGGATWAAVAAGIALIAAAPLSWGVSPDYARYLPTDTSNTAVALWTALGGFIPSVLLGGVGVLAGTVIDMSDAQTNLATIVPAWFYPVFLLVIVVGSMANNVLTMYSSGLYLQAVGIPLRRSITVLFDGALGIAIACYALFVSDFTSALSGILELSILLIGPTTAIYVTDQWLRGNRYDGLALNDVSPRGTSWYTGGFNVAGLSALLSGAGAAALFVQNDEFAGPLASALGGADLSWLAGPLVASCVYIAVTKICYPGRNAPKQKTALPVSANWFRIRAVSPSLDQIDEPHVHELLRANIWHLRGRDRDLIVDTGLGVASLRKHLPHLFDRDPIVVLTHGHLDHMGGAHEFSCCWAHLGESFQSPPPGSLYHRPLMTELGITGDDYPTTSPILMDAMPTAEFVVGDYRLQPAPEIRWVGDGARIDLGDRAFTILHLPGHTPASIGLFDEASGALFSGDVVYDDSLIDDCVGSDVAQYRDSMQRLIDLGVTVVHPGHGDSFDGTRLREIASDYLVRTEPVTAR